MDKNLTPVMKQYWKSKQAHPDKIVLFQMGDFFEMFYKDAEIAAPLLNIALTARNKKTPQPIPMCGVPLHSVSKVVGTLLLSGYKVAICDQVENSQTQKGLVERKVSKILSPGMAYDPYFLDELKAHYICAFDRTTCSFVDSSTGEAFTYSFSTDRQRDHLILLIEPVELIFCEEQKNELPKNLEKTYLSLQKTNIPSDISSQNLPESAQRILSFLKDMGGKIHHIKNFEKRYLNEEMEILPQTFSHLEITQTFDGKTQGSLFSALKRTKTPAGARLLKSRLLSPLTHQKTIESRLNRIEFFIQNVSEGTQIRETLSTLGDLERKIGKICSPSVNARDLWDLSQCILSGLSLKKYLSDSSVDSEKLHQLGTQLENEIREMAPLSLKEGGIFNRGFDSKLDELVNFSENSKKLIQELENEERLKTGIPSLKIRYNQVTGYSIEVTKSYIKKVPTSYTRKQTLTHTERYTTQELRSIEEKVLKSKSLQIEREYMLFQQKLQEIYFLIPDIHRLARLLAELDVSTSFAYLSLERNYTRPQFSNQIHVINSRHPVIEQTRNFTPNTISMKAQDCILITGPNMAGKSTLMRQLALSALMAQAGFYVPAEKAQFPIFRKLFTRIGSSDKLHSGFSTFMVEMTEAAQIIERADENSLVVLDELGRGTSTYDGLSLAQAILERLISKNKSYILFSTHYHELTTLQNPHIHQGHMAVSKINRSIDFLYTFKTGSCLHSYGIDVGEKAGLPSSLINRARHLLENFEKNNSFLEKNKNSSSSLSKENFS